MKGSEGAEHVRLIGIIAEPRLEGGGGDCLGDDAEIVAVRDGAERGEHGHEELLLLEGVVEQRGSALLTWYHFGGSAMAAVQNRNKNKSKARSALTLTAGCRSHTRGREERARIVIYSFPPSPGSPSPRGPGPRPSYPMPTAPPLPPGEISHVWTAERAATGSAPERCHPVGSSPSSSPYALQSAAAPRIAGVRQAPARLVNAGVTWGGPAVSPGAPSAM